MKVLNDLLNYNNMKIYQDTDMFSFSLDSVLLANFVKINKSAKTILDIGTGNAVIPLILSTKTSAHIVGVEIQSEVYALAKKSIEYNCLENQIEVINSDIKNYIKDMDSDQFDVVTCNPPFFKIEENSNKNDSIYKTIARHEIYLTLEDVISVGKKILKNTGSLFLVHRANRLIDIISQLKQNNLEPKRIQFVFPKKDKEANMVLIEATKNGRPGIKIMPPIYAHLENGEYTQEIKRLFE